MSETSLFAETENHLYLALLRILRAMERGTQYHRWRDAAGVHDELRDALHAGFDDESVYYPDDAAYEDDLIELLFTCTSQEDGRACYRPRLPLHLPRLPEQRELSWLRALLLDPIAAALLPDSLHEKLLRRLQALVVPPLDDIWQRMDAPAPPHLARPAARALRTFLDAYEARRRIRVDGKLLAPCRLLYDLDRRAFLLCCWDVDAGTPLRLPLTAACDLTAADTPIPDDVEDRFAAALAARRTSVTFCIENTKNTVERCFELFSPYDKEAHVTDDFQRYELTLHYDEDDAEDIFEKLLSFGPRLVVLAPAETRAAIIDAWRALRALYADAPKEP